MIPVRSHLDHAASQPRVIMGDTDIVAWRIGRVSLFVIVLVKNRLTPDRYSSVHIMYFRRPTSCPQVLARWGAPTVNVFPDDIRDTYNKPHYQNAYFDWPQLFERVELTKEQREKVLGIWFQPPRKKEGKHTTKKPYRKVKRIVVMRNDNVNIGTLFPGCEVEKVTLVEVTRHDARVHPVIEQRIKMNLREARVYKNCGIEFYATVNKSSVRFRAPSGQWRISFSSEDRDIKSFTVMVTIKKEPSDGNV